MVHNQAMRDYVWHMAHDHGVPMENKNADILIVPDGYAANRLRGRKVRVIVDHAVEELLTPRAYEILMEIVAACAR